MSEKNNLKALALFSGGLDSILSVELIRKQDIKVIPVFFESPFFKADKVKNIAKKLGWKVFIEELKNQYLKIVENPDFGYGKNINPCIDCHAFMFKRLGDMLSDFEADFLISGEVLGQRPKSQNKVPLATVSNASGYKDLIVRPLSQKLLPDTKPIRKSWVEKNKLLDIKGRSRKRQQALAKEYGIDYFLSTGGGCSLTDRHFCRRVKDLMDHDMWTYKYVKFLTWGRHFRLDKNTKLVLGRDEQENTELSKLLDEEIITLKATEYTGPLGILFNKEAIEKRTYELSAGILLRYITEAEGKSMVNFFSGEENFLSIEAKKMKDGKTRKYLL
ncbi:MAG: DUF814 domain-containing protein [Candidatus Cloacimonetes bacterium]|nr:DUF814 domain-containing protein [Candidatus Cloacimonadota bacterium]MBS3766683.1 DUF814 domain-containing protein [Candidatus Cloacimonadota bacterium]